MKLTKPKSKKGLLITAIVAAVVVVVGAAWFQFARHTHNDTAANPQTNTTRGVNDVNYSPPSTQDKTQQDQQKQQIIDKGTSTGNTQPNVSVSISRLSQDPGQPLFVRTIIYGTTTGTCDVVLTQGAQTVTKSFPVIVDATYSTCADAQVAAGDIPANGAWSTKVVVHSNGATAQSAPQTVNIDR